MTWASMSDVPRGLLRETLRGRMTPERAAGCLDSQTLAAWSEGTLSARDREAIEEHASDCARCQALLAAMVTTTPTIAPSRWWRPSTFGWLAPLAAAAAAILVWINVPRSPVNQPATPPAVATAKSEPPASVVAPPPTARDSTTPPSIPERRPVETRRQERARTAAAAPPPVPSPAAPQADTKAAAAPAQTKDAVVEPARDLPLVGKLPPADASAAAPAPPVAAPVADAGAPAKFGAVAGGRGGAGGGMARRGTTPPEIVSPDASVRWRILTGGAVARSIDRGATWQEQSTGASVMLTAGAAPSRDVCWLVGPGGIIVVSTDGLTWQRVAFPQAIDLTAVRASDGSNASVTAIDGRTFTTVDGGKNWRQP